MIKNIGMLFLVLSPLFFSSCAKDESVYEIQQKENVEIDNSYVDEAVFDKENQLRPGLIADTILVEGATSLERVFKYYFPLSLQTSKPISLIFDFHGSMSGDPMLYVSRMHVLNLIADTANAIVVFPKGLVQEGTSTLNWTNDAENLPFFDAMVNYFLKRTPTVDANRIYSCGHSSGAIFSFNLALKRSEVVAAVTPVSGQYRLIEGTYAVPPRTTPIRAFNGQDDAIVNYAGASFNFEVWAQKIGDYWAEAQVNTNEQMKGYAIDKMAYTSGKVDLEFYGIQGVDHGVDWEKIAGEMWHFMRTHPKDLPARLFIQLKKSDLSLAYGTTGTIEYKATEGQTMEVTDIPAGWNVTVGNQFISITAPTEGEGNEMSGTLSLQLSNEEGETITKTIDVAAADVFTVGDIYMDSKGNEIGVVFWVNPENGTEAKIVALEEWYGLYWGVYNVGLAGATDPYNGRVNTRLIVDFFTRLTEETGAAHKCQAYLETSGWYLPAREEWAALMGAEVLPVVTTVFESLACQGFEGSYYWTSTENKVNFAVTYNKSMDRFYTSYTDKSIMTTRAIKQVNKIQK